MKKLLTCILAGLLIGMGVVQYFDNYLSPNIVFFKRAAEQSDLWAAKLRENGEPCYLICGSSDVRMGVDPALMLEEGVRAVNVSYNAGFGENAIIVEALRQVRPGDTLVLVPLSVISSSDDIVTDGIKIGFQRHGINMFEPGIINFSASNVAKILTGDMHTMSIYLAKKLVGRGAVYRYNEKTCVLHESGWVELFPVLHRTWLPKIHLKKHKNLSTRAKAYDFSTITEKFRAKGVDVIILNCTSYGDEYGQTLHAWMLLQYVKAGHRVLKDPTFGIVTDIGLLADSPNHLTAEGAKQHSKHLAELLKKGEYWTEEELVQELEKRGWNEDGSAMPEPEGQAVAE